LPAAVERTPSRLQRAFGDTPTAWLWVAPAVVIILGLSLVPMGWALLLSFQKSDLVTPSTWVGIDNYKRLADDPTFRGAVQHTLLYTAAFVPLSIGGGLGIALLLNRSIRFIGFYRTLVFVPYIMSATAQGVLFSFVFDSQFGVANSVLHHLGMEGYRRLTQVTIETRERMVEGIRAIDGLRVLGEPEAQIVAMASTRDDLDVFAVGDALQRRGWYHDRQGPPDTLHSTVSAGNAPVIDEYLRDLRECVAEVGATTAADRSTSYATLE